VAIASPIGYFLIVFFLPTLSSLLLGIYIVVAILLDCVVKRTSESISKTATVATTILVRTIGGAYILVLCWGCIHLELTLLSALPIFMLGLLGGGSIIVAHELIHRRSIIDQLFGSVLLCFECYGTFRVEHIYGHHLDVCTPHDASSAPIGRSVYAAVLRSVHKNVVKSYRISKKMATKSRLYAIEPYACSLLSCSIVIAFYWFGGLDSAIIFVLQAFVAVSFLEAINYVQHYGLRRKKCPNGEYEKVSRRHAWCAATPYTQVDMLKLSSHAEHHVYERRPFSMLTIRMADRSLPVGYIASVFVALLPRWWFAMMDPLVRDDRR